MSSSVLLGNRLRRQIRAKVWPVLAEEGFVEFAPLRAYRVHDGVIEVVEFTPVRREWREPRWLGGNARSNGGTFMLHVGTYFTDVDRLPWAVARESRPKAHECHRCSRLAHESEDSECDGRTFWPGSNGERLEEVVEEAVRVLRARGLKYLDDYRDADGWLAAHEQGSARHPGSEETVELTAEEAAEALRIAREGKAARADALRKLHTRMHLSDEHLTPASPCADVLAGLLIGRGRAEDAMRCLEGPKQEQLRQLVA
ncbi:hypothetical protein EON82_14195 [bacterium]|nr:MAG: hypothetical protein EON82_14195 [bacterium]